VMFLSQMVHEPCVRPRTQGVLANRAFAIAACPKQMPPSFAGTRLSVNTWKPAWPSFLQVAVNRTTF
jgi:hypothetical protein